MSEQRISLAFTTYSASKLFVVAPSADGGITAQERTFQRCMGLSCSADTIYLSSLHQIWRLENSLTPAEARPDFDRAYVPQVAWTTGDIDVHDISVDSDGRVNFVSTLFSCIATISEQYSFIPLWAPPFISRLAAEDRCHLNGMALKEGKVRYVSMVSESDVADGWRDHRQAGGIVMDVQNNEVICRGLSMPHSPRWHKDRLWILNSGSGEFGYIDIDENRFRPVAFCPGYLRGLSFCGDYALVGLSLPRNDETFGGLKLDTELRTRGAEPRCGVYVIDLRTGDAIHWLRVEGLVSELYDVGVLANTVAPQVIGIVKEAIKHTIRVGPMA